MTATWARARSLAAQVDAFAPPGWRRDPAWWFMIGATAALEPRGRRHAGAYLASDAGPAADTFMGLAGPGPRSAAAWIAWAIAAAHAAVDAIARLDGTLPEQPLAVTIARTDGAAHTRSAPDRRRVGFAVGDAIVIASLDPRGPGHEGALAARLADALAGRAAPAPAGPPPLVAVILGELPIDRAHHAHRRLWSTSGGPWLGVGRAAGLTIASTCHLAVDGFGHAALTRAIVDGLPAQLSDDGPAVAPAAGGDAEALDVAWRALPHRPAALPLAFALAGALTRRGIAAPILQLPVAPGAVDDPARFARRVRPAWLTRRAGEPYADFAARAKVAIAAEAASAGVAARMLDGMHGLPLSLAAKRRLLAAPPSRWLAGPTETLAGHACLSVVRGDGPLIAVSAPPAPTPRARGGAVATVVTHPGGAVATVATVGPWSAATLLDDWLSSADAAPPASR